MTGGIGGLALTLATVSLIGLVGICERCGLGARAWRHITTLVAIVGCLTIAAAISLVISVDHVTLNSWTLWPNGTPPNAADGLAQTVLLGNCGFLWAVIGIMAEEQLGVCRQGRRFVRHWAGGCLLFSALTMVLLLPMSAALLAEASTA